MSEKNYPPLPGPCSTYYDDIDHEEVRCYSGRQMHAYIDADRAQRLPLTDEQCDAIAGVLELWQAGYEPEKWRTLIAQALGGNLKGGSW